MESVLKKNKMVTEMVIYSNGGFAIVRDFKVLWHVCMFFVKFFRWNPCKRLGCAIFFIIKKISKSVENVLIGGRVIFYDSLVSKISCIKIITLSFLFRRSRAKNSNHQ